MSIARCIDYSKQTSDPQEKHQQTVTYTVEIKIFFHAKTL